MSIADKKTTSFRLTREAKAHLEALAEHLGISQTSVIEVVLREKARREGIYHNVLLKYKTGNHDEE